MTAVVVTGMHRSGTSLVAGLLHSAGVSLGERLLPGDAGNPRGYFEDEEIFRFHAGLLARRGRSHLVPLGFTLEPDRAEAEEARRLVAARVGQSVWGWKDPRTSLLLGFWAGCLPEARFVFSYRHPLEVLLSFVRRGEPEMPGLLEGLDAWQAYNGAILDFRRSRSRTLLVHARAVAGDPAGFLDLVRTRLELPLVPTEPERSDPEGLRSASDPLDVLAEVAPACRALYRALETAADLPGDPGGEAAAPTVAPLARPAARARLLAWLAAADPSATEAFYAAPARSAYAAAQQYAWSIEAQIDALRKNLAEAGAYARSVEEARSRAEDYARSLESELARLRSSAGPAPLESRRT